MAKARAADPQKGSAAQSSNGHKTVSFRELELSLPGELPLSISFDLAGIGGPFADLRFLNSVLGPDQIQRLRDQLDADKVQMDPKGTKILGDLINSILELYGFETGESQASPSS